MKSAAIFDFGGVLVDWDPRHLYRKLIDDEAAMEHFLATVCNGEWNAAQDAGRSWAEATALLVRRHPEQRALIEAYRARWPEMVAGALDGTVALLDRLRRRGTRLYGLTNWSAETFPLARERFAFFEWFDGIVVSGEVGMIKPSPAIFRHLFARFDLDPRDAIFIDDNPPNVEAARALGLDSHRFETPEGLRGYLEEVGLL